MNEFDKDLNRQEGSPPEGSAAQNVQGEPHTGENPRMGVSDTAGTAEGAQRPSAGPGAWQSYPHPSQQNAPHSGRRENNNPYPPYYQQYPYQYGANQGWQPNEKNEGYHWSFEEYGRAGVRKKKSKGPVVFTCLLVFILIVSLVGVSVAGIARSGPNVAPPAFSSSSQADTETEGDTAPYPEEELTLNPRPGSESLDNIPTSGKLTIPQIAAKVGPSVVGIVQQAEGQYFAVNQQGSGIIMSENGYIITNAHVVEGARTIKVVLSTEEIYQAELVGSDPRTDLAVLKIEPDTDVKLIPAEFGDSNQLVVGETVIAIGNPSGLELAGTVTNGIVSALNREIKTDSFTMNYIQTNAAINPGNSGGALCNEYGQVVGINSAKLVEIGYEGIGFAIPISEAKEILDDLIANGRVTGRVKLGIRGMAITDADAENYGVPKGILIESVERDSDMASQGVQSGDIITYIDDTRVMDFDEVRAVLDQHKVGDTVTVTIYRQVASMKESNFQVTVKLMEDVG